MKKTILAISAIVMITSNLFAVADTTPTLTPKFPLTVNSSNWTMGGRVFEGKFPIEDTAILTKAHGGNLSPIAAYSDGMGVKVVSTTSAPGETINNSAYNDLVFKYGQEAKVSGLSLADQVLTGTNKIVPSMKDIQMANKLKNDATIAEKNIPGDKQDIAIKCSASESITLAKLKDMIANNEDVTHVCTSGITDMSQLFYNNSTFNQDISRWDTSHVTSMSQMFFEASIFNQPIGRWDTSNVSSMYQMFSVARAFNQPIGDWDTSHVPNMYEMFVNANNFNQPLSNWDTSNVCNMKYMFYGASSFDQNISNWNVSNVTNHTDFSSYSPIDGTNNSPF